MQMDYYIQYIYYYAQEHSRAIFLWWINEFYLHILVS